MAAYSLADTNLFAYCRNNPVGSVDEYGKFALSAIFTTSMVVGAIAGALVSGLSYIATNQGNFDWDGFGASVIVGAGTGALASGGYLMVAATTAMACSIISGTIDGNDPGTILLSSLFSFVSTYTGGEFGNKLGAHLLRTAGNGGGNFLGSFFAAWSMDQSTQIGQTVLNNNNTSRAPATSNKQTVANKASLNSEIRTVEWWMKYYG